MTILKIFENYLHHSLHTFFFFAQIILMATSEIVKRTICLKKNNANKLSNKSLSQLMKIMTLNCSLN